VPAADVPPLSGEELPALRTPVPGPRSRALATRLASVECRTITRIAEDAPIFWEAARGAAIRDADGNVYVDLTAGFGVSTAGHANPHVAAAIGSQAARLPHALGDVHPAVPKVALLERLAAIAPGDLSVTILASAGAEAVEAALKTAMLHTGRPGILAFDGAYHGLTYGALAATARSEFRAPFERQLFPGVRFAPYPPAADPDRSGRVRDAIAAAAEAIRSAERGPHPIGAVIVEPMLGRGGLVVPAPGFLRALRDLCDGVDRILIFDEIYTGIGRTGAWFCCEHEGVVPDVIVVGKALTGSLPLSAAIGSTAVMRAWPPSAGEAIHTSTFLGNPIACAAALAQLDEIEGRGLVTRAAALGRIIGERTAEWARAIHGVVNAEGRGLLQGVRLSSRARGSRALEVCRLAQNGGVLVLAEGPSADVLAITPPAVITETQLGEALDVIEGALRRTA
jgi:4-aminobutyrate aminotransferase-like enzyme